MLNVVSGFCFIVGMKSVILIYIDLPERGVVVCSLKILDQAFFAIDEGFQVTCAMTGNLVRILVQKCIQDHWSSMLPGTDIIQVTGTIVLHWRMDLLVLGGVGVDF